ncbi:MAG TPA: DUF3015 family protein [Nitrospira sp.]|nr:DUF3015 family protein [Nitrospira sp.]
MRKRQVWVLIVAMLCAMQTGIALASGVSDLGPGCGLGKVAWQDSKTDTNTVGAQLLISTTNNTILPWQAFGITTGIFGCKNNGKVWAEHKVNMFASINFENVAQDMAQGSGEHLASLATLMGVPEEQQPAFFAMAQDRYTTFMDAGETSSVAMVKALNDAITAHPVLAKYSAP